MFREDKATEMAAQFLHRAGGRMEYIELLKLMYNADKRMLLEYNRPMTYDDWVSLRYGPVLSRTYDLIKQPEPGYWSEHIRTSGYFAELVTDPGSDALSRAEDRIVDQVFKEHGHKDKWDLVAETHGYAEWQDLGDSSRPITYRSVLEVEGVPAEVIPEILAHIREQDEVERLLGV
jgi:uncharacterized phage-associated protein